MNKKENKKILVLPLIISLALAVFGVIMLISGINKYKDKKQQHKIEMEQYEQDKDKWFNNPGQYDMPDFPGFGPDFPFTGVLGIVMIVASVPCLIISVSPIIFKKVKPGLTAVKQEAINLFDLVTGKKPTQVCSYCGSVIEGDKGKCNNCGANMKK